MSEPTRTPDLTPGTDGGTDGEDILLFEDELVTAKNIQQSHTAWRVLVVDDEEDIFRATEFSLRDVEIDGHPIELLQARSGRDALKLIAEHPDLAVVLLDVVMETPDAGLRVVERIRAMPGREALRLILRTGQPGYAPELDVIRRYDINDYKTKSELNQVRLVTCLTVAVRGYRQLIKLQSHQRGLEKVVAATGTLVTQQHSMETFAEGVLSQICEISECMHEGAVVFRRGPTAEVTPDKPMVQPLVGAELRDNRVVAAAGAFSQLVGEPLEKLPAGMREALAAGMQGAIANVGDYQMLHVVSRRGEELCVLVLAQKPLEDIARHMLEVFASNISLGLDNLKVFEELAHMAHHDVETGLPNRLGLRHKLDPRGVLFAQVHINELDNIRGTLGEDVTRKLIAEVGQRLKHTLGDGARVARINGDRLALAISPGDADNAQARVLTVLSQPVQVAGLDLELPIAVGWSVGDGSVTQAIDEAGIVASHQPSGRQLRSADWTPELGEEVLRRVRLLSMINEALNEDRIEMYLQPQVRLSDGAVIASEALVRWRQRDGRMVLPALFIPMAEQSGQIRVLGERVMLRAVQTLSRWHDKVHRISVNVSVRQLEEAGFAQWLRDLCEAHQVAVRRVRLEITESAFTLNHTQVQDTLEALSQFGFEMSIDDFGTGHSSLGRLTELKFQELKIDRSLVSGVETDARARKLAMLIVELGKDLGVEVLAEGLETEAQAQILRDMGCVMGQGWLFGKPAPVPEFEALYPIR